MIEKPAIGIDLSSENPPGNPPGTVQVEAATTHNGGGFLYNLAGGGAPNIARAFSLQNRAPAESFSSAKWST